MTASRRPRTLAPLLAVLSALSPPLHPVAVAQDYRCEIDLDGAKRPMYTDGEMDRMRKCFVDSTDDSGAEERPDHFEIVGQLWDPDDDEDDGGDGGVRRRRRARGGSLNRAYAWVRCPRSRPRGCLPEALYCDRRRLLLPLPGVGPGGVEGGPGGVGGGGVGGHGVGGVGVGVAAPRRLDFASEFEGCLSKDSSKKSDYEAFDGLRSVSVRCYPLSELPSRTGAVHPGEGGEEGDGEVMCETEIDDGGAMLSEAEMTHYNYCVVQAENEYRAVVEEIGLGPTVTGSEIVEQRPTGDDAPGGGGKGRRGRGRGRGRRDLARRRNRVRYRTMWGCRTGAWGDCDEQQLYTRRALLRSLDETLCDCLSGDGTWPAFPGVVTCDTSCDGLELTGEEFEAMERAMVSKFERRSREEATELEARLIKERAELERKFVEGVEELRREKTEFEAKQAEKYSTLVQYLGYEKEALVREVPCVRLVSEEGCDDITVVPEHIITIDDADFTTLKFRVHQNFNRASPGGGCLSDSKISLFVRYVDDTSGGTKCKGEEEKCGDSNKYQSKGCLHDDSTGTMRTDVDVTVERGPIIHNAGHHRDRRRIGSSDDGECDDAMVSDAYCRLRFSVDCGCGAGRL